MIEVKNLHKYFGELQVLRGIDETIKDGEVVCVIGPSGSGKSTFLRCLNLLEEPTEGKVIIDGECINEKGTDIDKVREKLGMVFQNFNLFPHMTTLQNITLAPVQTGKMNKKQAKTKAKELLKRVGLANKMDVYSKLKIYKDKDVKQELPKKQAPAPVPGPPEGRRVVHIDGSYVRHFSGQFELIIHLSTGKLCKTCG